MRIYTGRGLGDFYYALIRDLTQFGREVTVRGKRVLEFKSPVTLIYDRPGFCWMNIPGRKFNPFFALAEVAWILSGDGSVKWISYFNKNLLNLAADPGENEFHGAYGTRIRRWPHPPNGGHWQEAIDQIEEVVRKLKADPHSRQAVISLWDPHRDNKIVSKDYPCNNMLYFSLRKDKLDMTVIQRSNDLVWGTPYNAIQFTHILALIAGELRVDMGKITYVIQNMHYYLDEYKVVLSDLISNAYKGTEAEPVEAGAVELPGFRTTTNDQLEFVLEKNFTIEKRFGKSRLYIPDAANQPPPFFGGDYWEGTIPKMIFIYTAIKEASAPVSLIVNVIKELGPLEPMILDFYSKSEMPHAIEVVNALIAGADVR